MLHEKNQTYTLLFLDSVQFSVVSSGAFKMALIVQLKLATFRVTHFVTSNLDDN
jgi:hypothetical protein